MNLDGTNAPTLTLLAVTVVLCLGAIRIRVRRPPRCWPYLGRGLSILGFALALSSSPVSAQERSPLPPKRALRRDAPAPPWSQAGGSPPPRPSAATLDRPWEGSSTNPGVQRGAPPTTRVSRPSSPSERSVEGRHPAIHGSVRSAATGPLSPLFPRHRPRPDEAARREAMRRHPSGKGRTAGADAPQPCVGSRYEVRVGDTLWDIAARALETDDLVRIARYWPSIHRANRDVIGPDPNLIVPGQVLRLPGCDR